MKAHVYCGRLGSFVVLAGLSFAETLDRLPLSFEANQGQSASAVQYLARGRGYTLFLTAHEAVMTLPDHHIVRMNLVGGSLHAVSEATEQLPGRTNYLIGNDPKKWRTHVPTYARVRYQDVYPGVDLEYYGNQGQLEYDFVLSPGANPNQIAIGVGTRRPRVTKDGELVAGIEGAELHLHKPVIYQTARSGERRVVDGGYVVRKRGYIAFRVRAYDRSLPLVIDPAVSLSTFLGGSGYDNATSITADASGNIYVAGATTSTDFPTTPGALQTMCGPSCLDTNAFVTKLNSSGSELIYSTYLGGSSQNAILGLAVDGSGNAYVTGFTFSPDFPTTPGAFQTMYPGGSNGTAFISKLNSTGSALVYSSFLGGSGGDSASQLAVDSSGDAYIVGSTCSTNFPVTLGAFQTVYGGGTCVNGKYGDVFVTKVGPTGASLVYSTYLGGSSNENGYAIAIDSSGSAYVGGYTCSTNFPVTPGAFQTMNNGGNCTRINVGAAFVSKLDPAGASLIYSSYLGGTGSVAGIAVNSAGNAYVTGTSYAANFPTTPGAFQSSCSTCNIGKSDGFVTEFNAAGSGLVYSTYLGGSLADVSEGIAIDPLGNAVVTGFTYSSDFPVTPGAFQTRCGGGCNQTSDAFITELNPAGSALLYSTFLGGKDDDGGYGVALDPSGNAYLTGYTASPNFPVTPGAFQRVCNGCANGYYDVFIVKFVLGEQVWPLSLNFGKQAVGSTSSPLTATLSNSLSATLRISSISITGANEGDFAQTNTCDSSLAGGASCAINITFAPLAPGARSATVLINDDAPNSPQMVLLAGIGTQPDVTLSPASLTFPTQVVFTTSVAQTVTLTNTGNGSLSISQVAATGPFHETNTCSAAIAPGATCTISVTFIPTSQGALTGSISITDNAPGSPQQVSLNGTGTLIQLAPTTLKLGHQPVGTTSLPKKITVSNKGSTAVTITGISIGGADAADFAQTNTCLPGVAAGASCLISVTFTPSASGQRTATVSVTDNGGGSPQTATLIGTGT